MLRFVFIGALVLLFVVPVYRWLTRRTVRIKSELENETPNAEDRLEEIKQKKRKLKADCEEDTRDAEQRLEAAKKIKKQI